MNWRVTYRRTLLGVVLGGALLGGAVYYARKVEPEDVEVVSVALVLPRLDGRFDGYRIAQISDLHADEWMSPGRASSLVDLVNAEKPDLVLFTGDLATYSRLRSKIWYVPALVAPLKRLCPPTDPSPSSETTTTRRTPRWSGVASPPAAWPSCATRSEPCTGTGRRCTSAAWIAPWRA
jgi:hypothetical protein